MAGGDPRGHYAVLGVGREATLDEIKHAFRERAKLLHPDTGTRRDGEAFQRLVQAYDVLRDPDRREAYDAEGERPQRTNHQAHRPAAEHAKRHRHRRRAEGAEGGFWLRLRKLRSGTSKRVLLLALTALFGVVAVERSQHAAKAQARAQALQGEIARLRAATATPRVPVPVAAPESWPSAVPGRLMTTMYRGTVALPANAIGALGADTQMRRAVSEVRARIAGLPAGADWRVFVLGMGSAPAAGGDDGLDAPLVRAVASALGGAGIDPAHLVMRVEVGAAPPPGAVQQAEIRFAATLAHQNDPFALSPAPADPAGPAPGPLPNEEGEAGTGD